VRPRAGRLHGFGRFGRTTLAGAALAAFALGGVTLAAQRPPADPLAALRTTFATPPDAARPMMRWWWFGPNVEPADLARELEAMRDAGLGGVEVQPVYPVIPDDHERGLINHPYLSPKFLEALTTSAAKAKELGLRYDLTLGSGWPYGGPHIPITLAAGRLRWEKVPVKSRRVPLPPMTSGERLIAVTLPNGGEELRDVRDDVVWLPEGVQPAEVWVFIEGRTGMMVKRAAVGAEGYVLDHYDREALQAHLDAVGVPLLEALKGNVPETIFCDSLEVFGSDWAPGMLDDFRARRGYDLRPHLSSLVSGQDAKDLAVRHDWARTLGELYEERFLQPLTAWTRARGSKLRIQGYGIPPATLSSNRFADLTDGEGAAWKTITPARWASSANHLLGRAVTASETWTWLHSPSFRATPLDLKAEADRHFLQGVNQFIGHGWPSTPPQIEGPGWRFYAAGALNDRNPWWIVMPDVSRYFTRVSALLREGQPVNDVALYLPTSDGLSDVKPGTAHLLDLLRERVGTAVPGAILDAGFGFDLVDDWALHQKGAIDGKTLTIGGNRYRAVVLPAVRTMPIWTLRRLADFAQAGGVIVTLDRAPESIPGLQIADIERADFTAIRDRVFATSTAAAPVPAASLVATLRARLTPDIRLAPESGDVGQHHRRVGDVDVYFLANTANAPRTGALTVRAKGRAEWWDPLSGTTRPAAVTSVGADTMTLDLELAAFGSTVLVVAPGAAPRPARRAAPSTAAPVRTDLAGPWTLLFEGKDYEPRYLQTPAPWDAFEETRYVSGVATYETTFTVAALPRGARVSLDFGEGTPLPVNDRGPGMRAWMDAPIRDAATIAVNGQPAGSLWTPPWRLDVTPHVRPGKNTLTVRVGNTQMNHMAGRPLPDYRLLILRYGDRFQPQTMDQVRVLPSGLTGPVRLEIARAR
jgi:hypothetical protein